MNSDRGRKQRKVIHSNNVKLEFVFVTKMNSIKLSKRSVYRIIHLKELKAEEFNRVTSETKAPTYINNISAGHYQFRYHLYF